MARKKSSGGAGSRPASKASARRVPMREFSRSLPMSLLRAREAVMRHFRPSLRDHGLTEQQWRILRALTSVDAIEVTELARVAFLLGPSLSRILRDLEARHLIERKVVKADQRRVVVSISARGLRLIEAVAPSSEAIYAAMTARYGARKLARLQEMLRSLEGCLSELRAGDEGTYRAARFVGITYAYGLGTPAARSWIRSGQLRKNTQKKKYSKSSETNRRLSRP
jgi:homoprotocatechuate degradation regulator HpaR